MGERRARVARKAMVMYGQRVTHLGRQEHNVITCVQTPNFTSKKFLRDPLLDLAVIRDIFL